MWMILLAMAATAAEPVLTGAWVLDEPDEVLSARHEAAVQAALDQLPWALRPLARSPLEQIVRSCRELHLAHEPQAFRVRCDDHPPFEIDPRESPTTIQGERGESVQVRFDVTADGATLAFDGAEGGQRSAYRVQGDTLQVTTRLQGDRLPEPISWTARYRRRP